MFKSMVIDGSAPRRPSADVRDEAIDLLHSLMVSLGCLLFWSSAPAAVGHTGMKPRADASGWVNWISAETTAVAMTTVVSVMWMGTCQHGRLPEVHAAGCYALFRLVDMGAAVTAYMSSRCMQAAVHAMRACRNDLDVQYWGDATLRRLQGGGYRSFGGWLCDGILLDVADQAAAKRGLYTSMGAARGFSAMADAMLLPRVGDGYCALIRCMESYQPQHFNGEYIEGVMYGVYQDARWAAVYERTRRLATEHEVVPWADCNGVAFARSVLDRGELQRSGALAGGVVFRSVQHRLEVWRPMEVSAVPAAAATAMPSKFVCPRVFTGVNPQRVIERPIPAVLDEHCSAKVSDGYDTPQHEPGMPLSQRFIGGEDVWHDMLFWDPVSRSYEATFSAAVRTQAVLAEGIRGFAINDRTFVPDRTVVAVAIMTEGDRVEALAVRHLVTKHPDQIVAPSLYSNAAMRPWSKAVHKKRDGLGPDTVRQLLGLSSDSLAYVCQKVLRAEGFRAAVFVGRFTFREVARRRQEALDAGVQVTDLYSGMGFGDRWDGCHCPSPFCRVAVRHWHDPSCEATLQRALEAEVAAALDDVLGRVVEHYGLYLKYWPAPNPTKSIWQLDIV